MVLEPRRYDGHNSNDTSESPIQVSPKSCDIWRRRRHGSITEARELLDVAGTGSVRTRSIITAARGVGVVIPMRDTLHRPPLPATGT